MNSNSFVVSKKGQEIQFDSAFSDTDVAKSYLKENLSYNTFAVDLYTSRKLSDKQISWIHYLATEHLKKEVEVESEDDGLFIQLVEKMYAKIKQNSRRFKVKLPGNVTISTVNKGVNQGALYLYENENYIGKITPKGQLRLKSFDQSIHDLMEDANENVLKLAQLYGHQTGCCSVCGRELSDPISIRMGIGPVCAKRFE